MTSIDNIAFIRLDTVLIDYYMRKTDFHTTVSNLVDTFEHKYQKKPVAFLVVSETLEPQWICDVLEQAVACINNKYHVDLFLLFDMWYKPGAEQLLVPGVIDSVYVANDLISQYNNVYVDQENQLNKTWNADACNFLFFTGYPAKFHRVRLLYKLWQRDLLQNCNFSFRASKEQQDLCLDFIDNDREFLDMINPTELDYKLEDDQQLMVTATDAYANVLFKVIAETDFDRPKWLNSFITEKTWKAIFNCVPFIVVGETETCKQLQDLGFKTFNEYMIIPNYDSPYTSNYLDRIDGKMPAIYQESFLDFYHNFKKPSWPNISSLDDFYNLEQSIIDESTQHFVIPILQWEDLRLNAVVENIKHFLVTLTQHKDQVEQDVLHNFHTLVELVNCYAKEFATWAHQHNLGIDLFNLNKHVFQFSNTNLNKRVT